MLWGGSMSRSQAATFCLPVLLDYDVSPGFTPKSRAGRPPLAEAQQTLLCITPHWGAGCGWFAFKKQASITWRSARQLQAKAVLRSAHWRKAGCVGSLPCVPWEPRQCPTSICAEGTQAALVSLRVGFLEAFNIDGVRERDVQLQGWFLGMGAML